MFTVATNLHFAAHRCSFLAWKGHIEDGLCVLHKCDRPACVNPDHLFLGTQKDNAEDRERKGRGNQPKGDRSPAHLYPELFKKLGRQLGLRKDNRGLKNGRAKLTVEQVLEIRQTRKGQRGLSQKYGVDRHTVAKIRERKLWGHVP